MLLTPMITFRGIEPSPALEADIREHIARLETYYAPITSCRVAVDFIQRRHERGNRFHVRIDVTVPGDEIVVTHDASLYGAARDVAKEKLGRLDELGPERKHAYVAVRDAFDLARRQLQDYARRQRGEAKRERQRQRPARGRILRLFPVDEYGYIEREDGHEVYFQKNSVLKNAFERLTVGAEVSFVEAPGDMGPQASTVRLRHPVQRKRHAPPEPVTP